MELLTNTQVAEQLGVKMVSLYALRRTKMLQVSGPHHIVHGEVERYLVDKQKRKEPKLCECGMMVSQLTAAKRAHLEGTYHKHYKRIKKLLAKPCLTLDAIGQRLGVTREYVRQIANKINVAPGPRYTICMLDKREQRKRAAVRARLGKVICQALTERELTLSGSARKFLVNGKSCALARSIGAPKRHARGTVAYYHAHFPRGEWQFVIVQTGEAIYVVPRTWLSVSIFIPVGRIEGYNGGHNQRDWDQWKDRWDLLQ